MHLISDVTRARVFVTPAILSSASLLLLTFFKEKQSYTTMIVEAVDIYSYFALTQNTYIRNTLAA